MPSSAANRLLIATVTCLVQLMHSHAQAQDAGGSRDGDLSDVSITVEVAPDPAPAATGAPAAPTPVLPHLEEPGAAVYSPFAATSAPAAPDAAAVAAVAQEPGWSIAQASLGLVAALALIFALSRTFLRRRG